MTEPHVTVEADAAGVRFALDVETNPQRGPLAEAAARGAGVAIHFVGALLVKPAEDGAGRIVLVSRGDAGAFGPEASSALIRDIESVSLLRFTRPGTAGAEAYAEVAAAALDGRNAALIETGPDTTALPDTPGNRPDRGPGSATFAATAA